MSEQKSYTAWLEAKNAELSERVTKLEECCTTQREGIRVLKRAFDHAALGYEVDAETFGHILGLFEEDGTVKRCP